jgi:stearoyl-CoA desaturase (delta-9 desaturase)
MVIYLTLAHVAAVVGLFTLPYCKWQTLLLAFVLWPISGLGITAGAHRLWAHRSYSASLPVRFFLMLCASIANQGSIYHWCRDHRVHHKNSETEGDPHNATRGFFFAHMGWLLVKKHPDVVQSGKQLDYTDLEADPLIMFQKRWDPWFALFMCFIFPSILCTLWGDTFWHGYWVPGTLRYVWVLHCTWLVNSAAHIYGDRPYDPSINPSENPFVALAAIGEGWHNWHHKYPFDYSASESGVLRQYNPTTLFIDTMARFGLVGDRKRATGAWNNLKATRAADIKKEH